MPVTGKLGRAIRMKSIRQMMCPAELQRRLLSNVNQGIADSGRRGAVRHNLLLDHGTGVGCLREHSNK